MTGACHELTSWALIWVRELFAASRQTATAPVWGLFLSFTSTPPSKPYIMLSLLTWMSTTSNDQMKA
ncbi:hypothetical protein RvY_17660 [Ramazzottius varieornatus]|uniref:Uncharacterized protein n=1 Tax=Ramazzottius varieornatus TaxID=947166 RepID=A0A1D1W6Q2_RAMVA|nr:hypothetical protein RvY_17660 [Ramazzottius varieornatus]